MRKSTIEKAQAPISAFFERATHKAFRPNKLRDILETNRAIWGIAPSISLGKFVSHLTQHAVLREVKLSFPHRCETIYTLGELKAHELAMALKPTGYLTHYSAMGLHGLTQQIPRNVYLNVEQPPKLRPGGGLEQQAISRAFQSKPRVSSNVADYGEARILLLSGKHTGGLGVVSMPGEGVQQIRVTGVERTLIDAAVRPFYSGGVFEVREAYRRARKTVNAALLAELLKRLDYIYPYHQAIGLYMEKAGCYSAEEMASMEAFGLQYDFYLTHQMKKPEYSSRWRIYFPKGF
jgi:predicted transcriptional regulator of viral defense system